MRKRSFILAVRLLSLLIICKPSSAQNQPSSTPITFAGIRFSGSLRVRPEDGIGFDTIAAEPNYGVAKTELSFIRVPFLRLRPWARMLVSPPGHAKPGTDPQPSATDETPVRAPVLRES